MALSSLVVNEKLRIEARNSSRGRYYLAVVRHATMFFSDITALKDWLRLSRHRWDALMLDEWVASLSGRDT